MIVPMSATDELAHARELTIDGHSRRALRVAWRAADSALMENDGDVLAELAELAESIAVATTGKDATSAGQLAAYCRHSVAEGGVESHSVISRISRIRRPRRTCPDCAEKVPKEARVCRYCGYRFDTEPA